METIFDWYPPAGISNDFASFEGDIFTFETTGVNTVSYTDKEYIITSPKHPILNVANISKEIMHLHRLSWWV